MKVYFSMLPVRFETWPGAHDVMLEHLGGHQKWHQINFRYCGRFAPLQNVYTLQATPGQLVKLAACMVWLRFRRWVLR